MNKNLILFFSSLSPVFVSLSRMHTHTLSSNNRRTFFIVVDAFAFSLRFFVCV